MERAEGENRERDPQNETRPHVPPVLESIESEDEDEPAKDGPPTTPSLRKGPKRSSRFSSSYKGMVGVTSTMDADSVFLATMDDRASKFSFSSASSYFASAFYLTEEGTIEDIHPCAFVSKVQTYE